jgi:hypothetical protein
MGLFNRMKEPVFLKESSNAEEQIEKLKILEQPLDTEGRALIKQDIKCLEHGIVGENLQRKYVLSLNVKIFMEMLRLIAQVTLFVLWISMGKRRRREYIPLGTGQIN